MKAIMNKVFSCLFCAFALLAFSLPVQAQQSVSSSGDTYSPPVPKDVRTRAKAHTELGSLYFQNGNLIVALEELTLAAAIDPEYATAFSTRGLVLYHVREFESAEKDFRRALSLEGRNPEINNNYGWFLCQTGKEKESIAYFQRAIRNPLYQTPEIAHMNAGACHIRLGELDVAEEYIRKTSRFTPDSAQALFHLATIQYKRGNFDAAREHLKTAARISEPNAAMLWLFLRVERRLGDAMAEKSLAAQLRRLYPDSPEYQAYLKGQFE